MQKTTNWAENTPKSFRVRADKIPVTGLEIEEKLSQSLISAMLHEEHSKLIWHAMSDVNTSFMLRTEANTIRLKGGASFPLQHACIRCLTEVTFDVPLEMECRLFPSRASAENEVEEDLEWFDDLKDLASDEGVAYYDDGIIDLGTLLREQLFLDVPAYPTCNHELAESPAECDFIQSALVKEAGEKGVDPRLAKLIDLRAQFAKSGIDKGPQKS